MVTAGVWLGGGLAFLSSLPTAVLVIGRTGLAIDWTPPSKSRRGLALADDTDADVCEAAKLGWPSVFFFFQKAAVFLLWLLGPRTKIKNKPFFPHTQDLKCPPPHNRLTPHTNARTRQHVRRRAPLEWRCRRGLSNDGSRRGRARPPPPPCPSASAAGSAANGRGERPAARGRRCPHGAAPGSGRSGPTGASAGPHVDDSLGGRRRQPCAQQGSRDRRDCWGGPAGKRGEEGKARGNRSIRVGGSSEGCHALFRHRRWSPLLR